MLSYIPVELCCPHCGEPLVPPEERIEIGNCTLSIAQRELRGPTGSVQIRSRAVQFLLLTGSRLNQTLAYDSLLSAMDMWDLEETGLKVAVCWARKALREVGADTEVRTYWGRGYGLFHVGAAHPDSMPDASVEKNRTSSWKGHGRWSQRERSRADEHPILNPQ